MRREGWRGGCGRGCFVENTCRFGTGLAPPFAGYTRTPGSSSRSYFSVSRQPYFLGRLRVRGAACRVAACRPPGPLEGEGERRGPDVGARRVGGGKGPSRKGRAALCGRRWERARLQHCYLRQRLSPAPRRPPPRGPEQPGLPRPGKRRWRWETAVGSQEHARGARAAGEWEPGGRGRGDRRSGAPGAGHSPAPEGQGRGSAWTPGCGAKSRLLPSSHSGKGWGGLRAPSTPTRVSLVPALPRLQRTAIGLLRPRRAGLDPRLENELGHGPPPGWTRVG